jgi:hypothetical protein
MKTKLSNLAPACARDAAILLRARSQDVSAEDLPAARSAALASIDTAVIPGARLNLSF